MTALNRRPWWRDDRGSASAEAVLVMPVLVMLLLVVAVVIHRGVDARLRINDAAHQAARAASIERTTARATAQAQETAAAALAAAGVTCQAMEVNTDTGGLRPGGTVRVVVSCAVDFGDALVLAVHGQKRLSATAIEPVDIYRSVAVSGGGA